MLRYHGQHRIGVIFIMILYSASANMNCNDYEIDYAKLSSCMKDSVLTFQFKNLELLPNCTVIMDINVEATEEIKEMNTTYKIQVPNNPLVTGEYDGCQQMHNSKGSTSFMKIIQMFGIPDECPIKKGRWSTKGKTLDISTMTEVSLSMLYPTTGGQLDMSHGDGFKSCLRFLILFCKRNECNADDYSDDD